MFGFKKKAKTIDYDEVKKISKYILNGREMGFKDKLIIKQAIKKGYKKELIKYAIEIIDKLEKDELKGGEDKMVKKDMDSDDYEEMDEEVEEDEEEEQEEEPIKPKKTREVKKESGKIKIGTIGPIYQQVGFKVFKGYTDTGEENWIPCDKLSEAETLSGLLRM